MAKVVKAYLKKQKTKRKKERKHNENPALVVLWYYCCRCSVVAEGDVGVGVARLFNSCLKFYLVHTTYAALINLNFEFDHQTLTDTNSG